MAKVYEPFLNCDGCWRVTRHHASRRILIYLGAGPLRVRDHYRLLFACNRCGKERIYGTERPTPKWGAAA